jgi:diguanylate cyclase (GGDEF)-like protein/PAS domain S-box-containing protein
VNEAYCRLTGYGVGEVIGTLLPSFPSDDLGSRLKKRKLPLPPGQFWRAELVKTHKNGSVYTVEQILTPLLDEQGLIKNFVSVLQDVTARKKVEAQMIYRAHHDSLTDLPNRVMFQDRLTQALAWAQRHGRLVSVMFLDLDGFKQINDEFGHGTGDKILQTIAARLSQCVRATDTVARLSGDEFTVILQDVQRVQDVYRVAQKILDCLEQPLPLEGHTLSTKTSMGIALYPLDGTDPDVLLQCADRAMYTAKGLGGQCCRFASEELNVPF